jgi:hypothetical protein
MEALAGTVCGRTSEKDSLRLVLRCWPDSLPTRSQRPSHAVAVARTSASASFDRGLTEHSNFSGLLKKVPRSAAAHQARKTSYARKDAGSECASGLDDATVSHCLLYSERGEHARDDDPDKGVRHPAAGADAPSKAERVVDRRRDAWVHIGRGEALRLEREGIWEEPVVV